MIHVYCVIGHSGGTDIIAHATTDWFEARKVAIELNEIMAGEADYMVIPVDVTNVILWELFNRGISAKEVYTYDATHL